jgi:hypothetical protein
LIDRQPITPVEAGGPEIVTHCMLLLSLRPPPSIGAGETLKSRNHLDITSTVRNKSDNALGLSSDQPWKSWDPHPPHSIGARRVSLFPQR